MAIGIRERASTIFAGRSRATSIASESLPVSAILRNPERILLVPGQHIEDVILMEAFVPAIHARHPGAHLAVVTHERLMPLVSLIEGFDRVYTTSVDSRKRNTKELEKLSRDISEGSFDVAFALCYEPDPYVGAVVSRSQAKLRVGFSELEDDSLASLNIVARVDTTGESYRTKCQRLFSFIDLGEPAPGFNTNLLKDRIPSKGALDYMRDRHGEAVLGFFFDQLDPLDRLKRDEVLGVLDAILQRRREKCVIASPGADEKEIRAYLSEGIRYLDGPSIVKTVEILSDCSWVITNSLGFSVLSSAIGSRVIYLGTPSRLQKFPLKGITSISFLSIDAGKSFQNSLVRLMEEKSPGE